MKNILKILIIVFVILFFIIKGLIEDYQLKKNNKYSIGVIINFSSTTESSYMFEFYYYINNNKYKAVQNTYEKRDDLVGKRFYVKFNPNNPDNCLMILDYPVPDCIKDAPQDGWKKIPTKCP